MSDTLWDKSANGGDGGFTVVEGSEGRENVSSRSASREFYLSRDKCDVASWSCRHVTLGKLEHVMYIQNTSTTQDLYIENVSVKSDTKCDFDVQYVTGTGVGVTVPTVNWCKNDSKVMSINVLDSGVTGLTPDGHIWDIDVESGGRDSYDFKGALILGEGDAIAITVSEIATVYINVVGAFE